MVNHQTKCAILLSYELAFTCRVTNSWLFKGFFWWGTLAAWQFCQFFIHVVARAFGKRDNSVGLKWESPET